MTTKAPFAMKGLDHVVVRCTDLATMKHFYCDVLGGTMQEEDTEIGLYQVRIGDHIVDLMPIDEPSGRKGGPAPGGDGYNMDHFAIQVEPYDDDAIRAYLSGHGVDLGATIIRGGAEGEGPGIHIKDPEGNTVELKGPPDPAYN
ncbi:MAG: VOC family protein [Rhodospirillaceae bacterium]|jgi:catechol 2,3-dioxygenase-like lactoylglutathione lyase family enzyme|nr:VOC family protein [Rhodospirillaceae bacterium]MBT4771466.1 VOC family protein [Rhodospirillaceae bacterium]MBT5356765.1 VOC family protein [Rhodospirillaceae bacterium]MBT5770752.1 VOC family protein [Rhodospirillaceae bacterium]MBT6311246.1 VOC family protein [Rhodospirillaceae bacterium]